MMEAIPEVFGSINTMMIELFDERYVDVTEVTATVTVTFAAVGVYGRFIIVSGLHKHEAPKV